MEKGVVVEEKNNTITVRFATTESCKKCGGCSISNNDAIMEGIENTIDARKGDTVFIETSSTALVSAATIIYVIPVAALVIGYFIGLFISNSLGLAEKYAVLFSVITFMASFYLITVIDKKIENKESFKPVAVRKA